MGDIVSKNIDNTTKEPQYGFLSPSGDFIPSPWGTHDMSARKIVEDNDWMSRYHQYREEHDNVWLDMEDFLVFVMGYILIDNPEGDCIHVNSNPIKQITRKQREFLYDYFMALGDRLRALHYYKED
jgi:hypothetical protein